VTASPCPMSGGSTLEHLLLDLLLPRLLAHDGKLVLHGGMSQNADCALCFVGPSGSGKSTLTGSLAARGYPLMSDDAVVLSPSADGWMAARIYPSLRLFPDTLDHLFPGETRTSEVADYTTKRRVPFTPGAEASPAAAVFRLRDSSCQDEIRIARLSQAKACMALIENSFALDAADPAEARQRFALASAAAQDIPVYDLHYPRKYDALADVQGRILEAVGLTTGMDGTS
jgi:GTPase SAR1 family protein